ncbi:MAG: hypothetical protein ACI9UT_001924 [Flavobacteriales bacterium]|jgi:hypothetical protein
MTMLIIIVTFASIQTKIISLAIFMVGLHRRYQANTIKQGAYYHVTI